MTEANGETPGWSHLEVHEDEQEADWQRGLGFLTATDGMITDNIVIGDHRSCVSRVGEASRATCGAA